MELTGTNPRLNSIIEDTSKESFKDPENADEVDALGIAIAHHFDWGGEPIIEAFIAALEDANFHSMCAEIAELAEKHDLDIKQNL
jgi:hypothetical protein